MTNDNEFTTYSSYERTFWDVMRKRTADVSSFGEHLSASYGIPLPQPNIEMFFKQPEYYKIDGRPVFMIYDVVNFIKGLGGIEQAAEAVKWFRQEVKKAGFPDLELQFTMWAPNLNYSGFDAGKQDKPENAFVNKIGFNSSSHYQFCHYMNMNEDYLVLMEQARKEWEHIDETFTIPYYPHVSIGWDNSPRVRVSAVAKNNTPENFEKALLMARDYADKHPRQAPLITINSWNEWTETSYLQPDDHYGYGYLEAVLIKDIFYFCTGINFNP